MDTNDFKVGDVVTVVGVKSPQMVVLQTKGDVTDMRDTKIDWWSSVFCGWFDTESRWCEQIFNRKILIKS